MPIHTVVCLEDDLDLARLIELTVRACPATVYLAHDGIRGLDLIRAQKPDVILLDLGLPGLNGWEICAAVKNDPDLCDIPIIVLTAVPIEVQERSALSQVFDYLVKPFSLGHLRTALEPVLHPAS